MTPADIPLLATLVNMIILLGGGLLALGNWRRQNVADLRQRAKDAEEEVARLRRQVEDLTKENLDLTAAIERVKRENVRLAMKTQDQQEQLDVFERWKGLVEQTLAAHDIRLPPLPRPE